MNNRAEWRAAERVRRMVDCEREVAIRVGSTKGSSVAKRASCGGVMRSQLIFGAMKNVPNRFQLVRVAAKATRVLHKPGSRLQDTMNRVLAQCKLANPIAESCHHNGSDSRIATHHDRRLTWAAQPQRKRLPNKATIPLQAAEIVLGSRPGDIPQEIH